MIPFCWTLANFICLAVSHTKQRKIKVYLTEHINRIVNIQVNVTNKTNNVDLENYVPNGEWELLDTKLVRMISYFPCCPEPYPYVSVTLK